MLKSDMAMLKSLDNRIAELKAAASASSPRSCPWHLTLPTLVCACRGRAT